MSLWKVLYRNKFHITMNINFSTKKVVEISTISRKKPASAQTHEVQCTR